MPGRGASAGRKPPPPPPPLSEDSVAGSCHAPSMLGVAVHPRHPWTRAHAAGRDADAVALGTVGAVLFGSCCRWREPCAPAYHAGSTLSPSDRRWVQTANFVHTGVLMTGFVVGVRRKLGGDGVR